MAYHFWRVRKAGGIILPNGNYENKFIPTYPNLVYKEFVVALTLLAVIFIFSVFFSAPLLTKANPDFSLNPTKAPWYFAGIQELLMHFHPFIAAFFIPLLILISLVALPFLKFKDEPNGIWFYSERAKAAAKISLVSASIMTPLLVIINEYLPKLETLLPSINSFITNGIVPLIILLLIIWLYHKYVSNKFELTRIEKVQTMFVFITTAFIFLTIIGIFFRGVDMKLDFPWNV
jgi:hypothetical protein